MPARRPWRWSRQAALFVRLLARCRARAAPAASRAACTSAFALRWSALLAFAAARSFASLLTQLSSPPLPVACRRYLWVVRGRGLLHWDPEVDAAKEACEKKAPSQSANFTRFASFLHARMQAKGRETKKKTNKTLHQHLRTPIYQISL